MTVENGGNEVRESASGKTSGVEETELNAGTEA